MSCLTKSVWWSGGRDLTFGRGDSSVTGWFWTPYREQHPDAGRPELPATPDGMLRDVTLGIAFNQKV